MNNFLVWALQPHSGILPVLIRVELAVACFWLLLIVISSVSSLSPSTDQNILVQVRAGEKPILYISLAFTALLSAILLSQFLSNGRIILSSGPVNPGSLLVRIFSVEFATVQADFFIARLLCLPALAVIFLLPILGAVFNRQLSAAISAISLLLSMQSEAIFLHPRFYSLWTAGNLNLWIVLHAALVQIFFIAFFLVLCGSKEQPTTMERSGISRWELNRREARAVVCALGGMLVLLIVTNVFLALKQNEKTFSLPVEGNKPPAQPQADVNRPLVGAHFYLWFPENWFAGTLGKYTLPEIKPVQGYYETLGKGVFAKQVQEARNAGIDFFIFDYWPRNPQVRRRVLALSKRPDKEWGEMKFSLHYETPDLREAGDSKYPGEGTNIVVMDDKRRERLKKHWEKLAQYYMSNPRYLRIHGRPVLFVYAVRHLVGLHSSQEVADAVQEARRYVWDKTGEDLFLVGDEAFFNVLDTGASKPILLPRLQPNWERIVAFDAITSYNPYDSSRTEFAGVSGQEEFLGQVKAMYQVYRRAAEDLGQVFIPGIIPGYNDRGVRLGENHYVVPRGESGQNSFFSRSLRLWGGSEILDKKLPVVAITSWNEWNEWTAIEPTDFVPETIEDESGNAGLYTQGIKHQGFARRHIEELHSWKLDSGVGGR